MLDYSESDAFLGYILSGAYRDYTYVLVIVNHAQSMRTVDFRF